MSKQFYIARHGLTEKPGVLLGQFDAALSAEGRRQAEALADQLAAARFPSINSIARIDRIVCSALRRARETAEIIAGRAGISVEVDASLNEISYGQWDGLTWKQIEQLDPEITKHKTEDWWSVTSPGGEPTEKFLERIQKAWSSLLANPAKVTLVVAHEAANALLMELAQRDSGSENEDWRPDWSRISRFQQKPGSLLRLDIGT